MNAQPRMADEQREPAIEKCMQRAIDTSHPRNDRRAACALMSALIAERSPVQVRRMERERGLCR